MAKSDKLRGVICDCKYVRALNPRNEDFRIVEDSEWANGDNCECRLDTIQTKDGKQVRKSRKLGHFSAAAIQNFKRSK